MQLNKALVYSVIVTAIFLFTGCEANEKSSAIQIQLVPTTAAKTFEEDFIEVLLPAITNSNTYPEFYQKKLGRFSGIPDLDSLYLVSANLNYDLYLFDLYSVNSISAEEFSEKKRNFRLDTAGLSSEDIRYSFNAISGFENDQHILIADLNNNYDFGDEKVYRFPVDSSISYFKPASLENLPTVDFKYQTLRDNELIWLNRKIKFFPDPEHPFAYLLLDGSVDSLQNRYSAMLLFQDHWSAKQTIEETPFNINFYGRRIPEYPRIIIKPDSIDPNYFSRDNFEYALKDTLSIRDNFYRIDSLHSDFSLFLTNLDKVEMKRKGRRMGEKMDDYVLQDLNGGEFSLLNISDKDYLLLDFWGTWCAPCKKLTPDIKRLYEENSEKFDLLSIAADDDLESVKSYIATNELGWKHAYLRLDDRAAPVRRNLRINAFPTFILLDREHKILMRGNSASFEKIRSFIESK